MILTESCLSSTCMHRKLEIAISFLFVNLPISRVCKMISEHIFIFVFNYYSWNIWRKSISWTYFTSFKEMSDLMHEYFSNVVAYVFYLKLLRLNVLEFRISMNDTNYESDIWKNIFIFDYGWFIRIQLQKKNCKFLVIRFLWFPSCLKISLSTFSIFIKCLAWMGYYVIRGMHNIMCYEYAKRTHLNDIGTFIYFSHCGINHMIVHKITTTSSFFQKRKVGTQN